MATAMGVNGLRIGFELIGDGERPGVLQSWADEVLG